MNYRVAVWASTAVALFAALACGGGSGTPSPTSTPSATSTAVPTATLVAPTGEPGAAAAIAAARADLATRVSEVDMQHMEVISITRHDWPDACLGLPLPQEECDDVVTPGYEIDFGKRLESDCCPPRYVYRSDLRSNVRFEKILVEG